MFVVLMSESGWGGQVIQVCVAESQKAGTWGNMNLGGQVEVMGISCGGYVVKAVTRE